jgi:hypothetical protein
MWRWHRSHQAPVQPEALRAPRTDEPSDLVGILLFMDIEVDGVVGLDCLLEEDELSVGIPLRVVWALPRERDLATWQLSMVEGWLDAHKLVRVCLHGSNGTSRLRLRCEESTLVVDLGEPADRV